MLLLDGFLDLFFTSLSGVSAARFFLDAGVFSHQVQGGTRRCALPFWCPTFLDVLARLAEQPGLVHTLR